MLNIDVVRALDRIVQLIEPASDLELQMVTQAQSLDPKGPSKPDAPLPPSVANISEQH
jgi:hypothetical protein